MHRIFYSEKFCEILELGRFHESLQRTGREVGTRWPSTSGSLTLSARPPPLPQRHRHWLRDGVPEAQSSLACVCKRHGLGHTFCLLACFSDSQTSTHQHRLTEIRSLLQYRLLFAHMRRRTPMLQRHYAVEEAGFGSIAQSQAP